MKKHRKSRVLSLLLTVAMLFNLMPTTAFAENETPATYELVTDAGTLKENDQIVIAAKDSDVAISTTQNNNNRGQSIIVKNGTSLTPGADTQVLTLKSATKEGTFAFYTGEGYLYAASSSKNYLRTEATLSDNSSWTIEIAANGIATVKSQGEYTRNWMRYNKASTLFACYGSGQQDIAIYKLGDSGTVTPPPAKAATPTADLANNSLVAAGTTVTFSCETEGAAISYATDGTTFQPYTAPVAISETTTFTVKAAAEGMEDSAEATFTYYVAETATIAEALAAAEGYFTVSGTVTFVDGKNVYLQDETGANGIGLYTTAAVADLKPGDVVTASGKRETYNGLPQLSGATCEKTADGTLTAKAATLDTLTAADVATYVSLKGLTVTKVTLDSKSGKSNIDLEDAAGNTIQLYRGVVENVAEGDIIDITAAVGIFKTSLQLRNTLAAEVQPFDPISADMVEEGVLTIDQAAAGTAPVSLIGQVVYQYGKTFNGAASIDSTILEDRVNGEIVGFQIFDYANYTDYKVGDVVKVTGTISEYNGVLQMNSPTMEVVQAGLTPIPAQEITVSEMGADYLSEYVYLKDITLGAVNGKNNPVTDATGTTNLYNAVPLPEGKTEADVTALYACCSAFRTSYQLRNGSSADYVVKSGDPVVPEMNYAKLTTSLADGDQFIIYYNKDSLVMSNTADGNKLTGISATPSSDFIALADGMSVLTAKANTDGSYTFTNADGKYLTSGATGNSLTFADAESDYSLWTLKSVTGGFHIVNKNAVYNGNAQALEIYNGLFTTFTEKDTDYYLFNLYKLTDELPPEKPDDPLTEGSKVVIYNLSSKGVLSLWDGNQESPSLTGVGASLAAGQATVNNGGFIFTVEKNGEYYRFKNDSYGYLCSNGTGNNAFYSTTASDDADWKLAEYNGGYTMESRTAKFNGQYSQFLEFYADAYKTYSMNKVTDKDIFTFQFYPCANPAADIVDGVVNKPVVDFGTVADAYLGQDYSLSFTVDAVFGVKELTVKLGEEVLTHELENGIYTVSVPADKVTGSKLTITVSGADNKNIAFTGTADVTVKDEPSIINETPKSGSETGENKRPVISAEIVNAGENPTVTMQVNGEDVTATYKNGKASYTPAADLADGRTTVTLEVTRTDGKKASRTWSFIVGESQFQAYFGQLHSHTTYSDGSGSLDSALDYVKNLPESANVDFVAFTDHSNYFDKSGEANPEAALYDMSQATAYSQETWANYKNTIADFNASQSDVVAIGGYEMTWSGGPGHMNTFNTPGIVSRNNKTLNNKTGDAGMKAYYELLSKPEGKDSISQFNHPGKTFGTFADFAYWDAVIDTRIQTVEVGNGEGQIGAGGYFPSYEYYTMALDKGWHLAPTNNQDNHKGKWGNANDARDVIITDDFSENGLYAAMRAMRMYSTEDKNLELTYKVNDQWMGSVIEEVPEKLNLNVTVSDPDSSDSISKVEVIVNSGKVAHTWSNPADLAAGELTAELEPTYSYYYIRVTENDGDLAVTAPVWVGDSLKLGISSLTCGTSTPVTNEELTLTTTLFNSETTDAAVKSITYSIKGGAVLGSDTTGYTLSASSTKDITFKYTPTVAKLITITATVVMEQDGQEYTFSTDLDLNVENADNLVYIGIDASHYNEYVSGNYKDSMGNFSQLASEYSVRTVQLNTSEDLIAAANNADGKYKALILTAPSRRLADAQTNPKVYTAEELAAINAFNKAGGMVILAGWSDNYENYPVIQDNPNTKHMAATQNEILETLGSSLRIGDDATYDDVRSKEDGVDPWRLYFNTYGDSYLTDGVIFDAEHPYDRLYTEVFSHYGGATVYATGSSLPETVSPVVFAHSSTYSKDVDGDGLGGSDIPKYEYAAGDERLMIMASEQLPNRGLIVVSGAAFMSNFEVQAVLDNASEKNYSNYRICENLLKDLNQTKITPIKDIQNTGSPTDTGYKFTLEGVVTSNASGYDKATAFFDCIYVEDATGGICCFPVSGDYKVGDKVIVTGYTEFYQGEMELQVTSIKKTAENQEVTPTKVSAAQINDQSVLGQLIQLDGTVVSFEKANGLVQTIMVKDKDGNVARVFIDGYITTDEDVKNLAVGNKITVTGLASYDDTFNAPDGPFARIRVRDRADVVCTKTEETNDTYTLSGKVTGTDGKALAGVTVIVKKDGKEVARVTTGADGSYSIPGLEAGEYTISYLKDGYESKEVTVDTEDKAQNISLAKKKPTEPGNSVDDSSNSGSSGSGSSGSNTTGVSGAPTGDTSALGFYLTTLLLAAGCLAVLYRRRRQF